MNQWTRRQWLRQSACGFGSAALAGLLGAEGRASDNPLAPRKPHHLAKAKRVIFLFMQGGPSHVDLFEHKPRLVRDHGKPIPFSMPKDMVEDGVENSKLLAPVAGLKQYGQSGLWFSELLPMLGQQADKLCMLHGMQADNPAHPPAVLQMQTGYTQGAHPAVGAWLSYGLGTENRDLPGFITIDPLLTGDGGGAHLFSNAYLPAAHQGMPINRGKEGTGAPGMEAPPTISYLSRPDLPSSRQRDQLALLAAMNRDLQVRTEVDNALDGMIQSFELAFRMQATAPGLLDLSKESPATLKLYGIGEKQTDSVGRQLLLARRLSEAGVRFVQVTRTGWDHHQRIRGELPGLCASVDRPIAGLLADLAGRGLLDDTLVVFTGEFGRSPYDQDITRGKAVAADFGRGHNQTGFTAWLAGGGVKGGHTHGATDEFGYRAIDGKVHIHDLHATMLHLMGLDHEKLTFRHAGRDFRLTDVDGRVVKEILA